MITADRIQSSLITFFVATLLLVACTQQSVNQPIFDKVYGLINDGEYKMAQEYFNNHKSEICPPMSHADSMYCNFLDEYFDYYNTDDNVFAIKSFADTLRINSLIDYYIKNSDYEKLAYSLLLKSLKLYISAQHNDGVYCLKQAETIIKSLDNSELKYMLASVNLSYNTNNLDCKAAMPLLDTVAKYAHNQREKNYGRIMKAFFLFIDHNPDRNPDAAKLNMRLCVADTTDYYYLSNYAWILADDEPEKCERYARKVLSDRPQSFAADYAKIAILKLYFRRGLTAEAEDFFQNNPILVSYPQLIAYEEFYNHYKLIGDYQKATKMADLVISIKNILINWVNDYKVSQNSQKFDFDLQQLENQNRFQRWIIAFVILVAAMVFLVVIQKRRYERELSINRQILKESRDRIDELNTLEKSDETDKEIQRLQRKITEIETRYAEIYHDGKILYDSIFVHNGNSGQWNKKDYERFLEYYKTIDLSLIAQIEDEYPGINPRQTFYKVLVSKGFDKPSIMKTMAIQEDVTFRALKSKVEGLRRKDIIE